MFGEKIELQDCGPRISGLRPGPSHHTDNYIFPAGKQIMFLRLFSPILKNKCFIPKHVFQYDCSRLQYLVKMIMLTLHVHPEAPSGALKLDQSRGLSIFSGVLIDCLLQF